jgi:hypothetical protein
MDLKLEVTRYGERSGFAQILNEETPISAITTSENSVQIVVHPKADINILFLRGRSGVLDELKRAKEESTKFTLAVYPSDKGFEICAWKTKHSDVLITSKGGIRYAREKEESLFSSIATTTIEG